MKKSKFIRVVGVACAAVMAVVLLGGCAGQNNQATEQQKANRQYMTQVNQTMEDLAGKLDGFSDAVARGDLVTMRTQADNAFKSIEDLNKIEAPEDMKKIQAEYVEGCNDLKDAMNAYIGLYSEIESATDDQPFDYGTYDERLKAIQDQYDKGIGKLQSGENKASELPS